MKCLVALFLFLSLMSSGHCAESKKTVNGLFPEEIISMEELHGWIKAKKKFLLLDARDKRSYEAAHLPGAVLPLDAEYYREMDLFKNGIIAKAPDYDQAFAAAAKNYPADIPIVTYCNSHCHAGDVLAVRLIQHGFKGVRSMPDGLQTWHDRGFPVVSEAAPVKAS